MLGHLGQEPDTRLHRGARYQPQRGLVQIGARGKRRILPPINQRVHHHPFAALDLPDTSHSANQPVMARLMARKAMLRRPSRSAATCALAPNPWSASRDSAEGKRCARFLPAGQLGLHAAGSHRGVHARGVHTVDPDVVLAEFGGKGLGHAADSELARGVRDYAPAGELESRTRCAEPRRMAARSCSPRSAATQRRAQLGEESLIS